VRYVIGIDGGGTKTVCVLANELGEVMDISFTGGSNHQICGIDTAVQAVTELIDSTVSRSGLTRQDISFVKMGLAGADLESDLKFLNEHFSKAMPGMKLEIVNDIWIAFSAGIVNGWGAVSICGTGHNTAVITPDGRTFGIRALKYILGNYGGGRHITDDALHCAFRSNEQTGDYTRLERLLPQYCGVRDMDELAALVYQSDYTYQYQFNIPKLVSDLADEGDPVSRRIVQSVGGELGRMTGGLIKKAGLCDIKVPVVLGGSIFTNCGSGLIIKCYAESLSKLVPDFSLHILKRPPVLGAVLTALKSIGVEADEALAERIFKNMEVSMENTCREEVLENDRQ
jgi:N-acetylglucosamine kinase-like BadF-type ATPase